jgi:predicted amidophosphoribosyltransferase
MVFDSRCAGCNQPGDLLCSRCRFSLAAAPAQLTSDRVRAALPFDGVARRVVLAMKYRNRRRVSRELGRLMVRRLRPGRVDVVTWAPTSGARVRARGYDQAELLARAVARELGVPCRRLLYRTHGEAQTGRSRRERMRGPSFRARPSGRPLSVLLVDDVVTTGATLGAAKAALLAAGVDRVQCIAAAATPSAGVCAQPANPAQRRTVSMAARGSSSTTTACIPTERAATTLDSTSSRKAVRSAAAPNLARAS